MVSGPAAHRGFSPLQVRNLRAPEMMPPMVLEDTAARYEDTAPDPGVGSWVAGGIKLLAPTDFFNWGYL